MNANGTTYAEWIAANVPAIAPDGESLYDLRGKCREFCDRMREAFPELELQAGFYQDTAWGSEQHWWLKAPDGSIVDPTAAQFPTKGRGVYEFVPEDERPVGKCANCGSLCFPDAPSTEICSSRCWADYVAYVQRGAL